MTELQPYRPPARDLAYHNGATASPLDSWVEMLAPVANLAERIAQTPFVPTGLRGNTAAVAAAILAGREMGLAPMQSLQHVHVIEGRPALDAEMARALAMSQGHDIQFMEMTTTRCVVQGRRRGEDSWTTVTWTMDDAKRAGLASKQNWQRHPRRMLQARASGELCHLLFADVISGIPAITEELEDGDGEAGQVIDSQTPAIEAPKQRTAQRATRRKPAEPRPTPAATTPPSAAPAAGPPLPGEPGYDDEPGATAGDGVTPDQLTKLHTVFTTHAVEDRDERLRIAARLVSRELATSKDLTKAEASTVIDTLERAARAPIPLADFLEELLAATDRVRAAEASGQDFDPETGEIIPAS